MRIKLALALFLCAPLLGQQKTGVFARGAGGGSQTLGPSTLSNLTVLDVSNTQAQIELDATGPATPIVEVSETPDFSAIVPDTNGALFIAANLVIRQGTAKTGTHYTFIAGKRATDLALDGAYYSRALKAAKTYYVRAYPEGQVLSAATTSFTTRTIPFGQAYLEGIEADPARPGNAKYQTLSWTQRNTSFAEPRTGLALKQATLPTDVGETQTLPLAVQVSSDTTWTLGSTVTSAPNGAGKLFLAAAGGGWYNNINFSNSSSYSGIAQPTYFTSFQANLTAGVNVGGAAPAAPVRLTGCLSKNGSQACYAGSKVLTSQPLSTSLSPVIFAGGNTGQAGDLWQSTPGTSPPDYTAQAIVSGSAVCNGTPTVTSAGPEFPYWLEQGSNIRINNIDYKLADANNNNATLSLTRNCPAGTYSFATYNFGLLVWNAAPSADVISISSASVTAGFATWGGSFDEGGTKMCSDGKFPDAVTGRPNVVCRFDKSASDYLLDTVTGDAKYRGARADTITNALSTGQRFSSADPTVSYGVGTGVDNSGVLGVWRAQYFGGNQEPAVATSGSVAGFRFGINNSAGIRPCFGNTASGTAANPCVEYTSRTGGQTLAALVTNFTSNAAYAPAYDANLFSVFGLFDVNANLDMAIIASFPGVTYPFSWIVIYNPEATSNAEGGTSTGAAGNHGCAGGGNPGCVIGAMPSWARPGSRWATFKDGQLYNPGWFSYSTNVPHYARGSGPYYMQMVDGTADGSVNTIDASTSLKDCPANTMGAPTTAGSKECTQITVASEPLPINAGAAMYSNTPGEFGNSAIGDFFTFGTDLNQGQGERDMILTKAAGLAAGSIVMNVWRDLANDTRAPYGWTKNFAGIGTRNLPQVVMTQNIQGKYMGNHQPGSRPAWNYATDPHGMNAAGTTIVPDPQSTLGHNDCNARGDCVFIGAASGFGGDATPLTPGTPGLDIYNDFSYRSGKGKTFPQMLVSTATYQKSALSMAGNPYFTPFEFQSHPGLYSPANPSDLIPDNDGMYVDARNYRGGFSSGNIGGSPGNAVQPQQPGCRYPCASNPTTGDLWDFGPSQVTLQVPYSLFYPIYGFSQRSPLVNISSPAQGNIIGTGPADGFKFCIAAVAGECRADSQANHLYANVPHVNPALAGCNISGQSVTFTTARDICVGAIPANQDAYTQSIGDQPTTNPIASPVRSLFRAFGRTMAAFGNLPLSNDNRFGFIPMQLVPNGIGNTVLVAQMPPRGQVGGTPGVPESGTWSQFRPVAIAVPQRANATAYVRFGYLENDTHSTSTNADLQTGDARLLNCTSRAEACVSAITTAWAPTETWASQSPGVMELTSALSTADPIHGYTPATLVPVDVSSAGATVYVPAAPAHTVYTQVVYKDKTSGALTTAGAPIGKVLP